MAQAQSAATEKAPLTLEEKKALVQAGTMTLDEALGITQSDKAPAKKAAAVKAPAKLKTTWYRNIDECREAAKALHKQGVAHEMRCRWRPGYPVGQQHTFCLVVLY